MFWKKPMSLFVQICLGLTTNHFLKLTFLKGCVWNAYEHEAEKDVAFALGLLAVKPEHQWLIADAGALSCLVSLLERRGNCSNDRAIHPISKMLQLPDASINTKGPLNFLWNWHKSRLGFHLYWFTHSLLSSLCDLSK